MSFIRAYLRASTNEQDAARAKESLIEFAKGHDKKIASFYTENESGRKLHRPVLMQLIEDATEGDIILVEALDRLTRLSREDWESLKLMIRNKGLLVVAVALPTSHAALSPPSVNGELFDVLIKGINDLLMDIMASSASEDYLTRRRRSAQGIAKAKAEGKYKGRPEDTKKQTAIEKLLSNGMTYSEIREMTGASRTTISKVKKNMDAEI